MKITVTPKNYAPIYAPVIYTVIEVSSLRLMEATIMGTGNKTLGIKHFRGEKTYAVNVGGYANTELDPQPIHSHKTGFYAVPSRTTEISMVANTHGVLPQTATVESSILIAAWQETEPMKQLAKVRKKTAISEGDIDEISFVAPQKLVAAIVTLSGQNGVEKRVVAEIMSGGQGKLTGYRCGDGVCAFIVNLTSMAELVGLQSLEGYSRMSVEVKLIPSSTAGNPIDLETVAASVDTVAKREYIITPPESKAVRLCWLNRQAGIDYYSFRGESTQTVVVDKSRAYTSQGYKTYSSQAETIEILRSEYEPEQTIEWLSDIIGASKVWRAEGEGKIDAMWVAMERFCCSYEYVRKCMYYYKDVNMN